MMTLTLSRTPRFLQGFDCAFMLGMVVVQRRKAMTLAPCSVTALTNFSG
jgi:hypothetical protein